MSKRSSAVFVFLFSLAPWGAGADEASVEASDRQAGLLDALRFRCVGPVNMSGRVSDVEGVPGDPRVIYVGAASGGVFKSEDGGVTFRPVFDAQPLLSIGDLALAPSNPDVIYAGTGESNVRNSVSYGDGVYRSTDGGDTWVHLGLEETRHISRIAVHPADPDTLFVGALGSIYAPSPHRGVYRSTDGGRSFEKVLFVDEYHGVADLDLDPDNPNVVFAAMWRFERKPWTHRSGSREGGIFRSTDGGKSWNKVTEGLPRLLGRVAVKIAPSDPRVVYVMAESDEGTLFRSDDRGKTFRRVSDRLDIVSRGFYYTDLRVDPGDAETVFAVASQMFRSTDGGRTFARIARKNHVDNHALWIDPANPRRMIQGQDGGIAWSQDGGDTWDVPRNLPIGQFYQVFFTMDGPFYRIGGGLQDNGTWIGPFRTRDRAGVYPDWWRMFSFGDAYFVVQHPDDPELFLSEWQAGGIVRTDLRSGRQWAVSPQPRRNDGGPVKDLRYRFNWNAPIVASPHDPSTVYFCGNVVFRSRDFGDTWEVLGGDLTTDDPDKQGDAGGPAWFENTTAEYHCTIISFAESPLRAGLLWAGTDDGNLQVSRDDGRTWTNVVAACGVPPFSPVSHVEPSRLSPGRVYVAFDRHMFDDYGAHLFASDDYGASFERIGRGLPEVGHLHVVREDPRNPDVLYAGTESGLYWSRDRGESFEPLTLGELPRVAVHDVLVHPTENDLIVGTHGRAIWVLDDATPLQRFGEARESRSPLLLPARPAWRHARTMSRYGPGDRTWIASNPPYGALFTWWIPSEGRASTAEDVKKTKEAAAGGQADGREEKSGREEPKATIEIRDAQGVLVRTLNDLPGGPGLHRAAWDLTVEAPLRAREDDEPGDFDDDGGGPEVVPGRYRARLIAGERAHEIEFEVRLDPAIGATDAELRAQFEAEAALSDRISALARRVRALDSVGEQASERVATLKKVRGDVPPELGEARAAFDRERRTHLDRLIRNPEKPMWSVGPRLIERASSLMSNLANAFAPPTAAQREAIDELEREAAQAIGDADGFLREGVGALNAALEAAGAPQVLAPEPNTAGVE